MKTTITTTTINIPYLLEDYVKDVIAHDRQNSVDFIIAGDKKSPPEAKAFCNELEKRYAIRIAYLDADEQERYLRKYPVFGDFLPWNCIQRRQVAILKAYEENAEIIILIDDDNYIACEDYVGNHLALGIPVERDVVSSPTGWYNICDDLSELQGRKFFPRGYSVADRVKNVTNASWRRQEVRAVVNAGFWLGDPDIDAVTRLAAPIEVTGYSRRGNYALAAGTYAPFNSQNTAIHRDVVPAYFVVPDIGRFDDIWASYVVQRLAWHMNDHIVFGQPLVTQKRNEHDLWVDAGHERLGMQMTTDFCLWLREIEIAGGTYLDGCEDIFNKLKKKTGRLANSRLPAEKRAYINQFIDSYAVWLHTIRSVAEKIS